MKKLSIAFILLFIVALAATAVAADQTIHLNTPTVVAGTKLAPGEYVVRYQINGKTADVKVLQNDKEVASTKGDVVETKDAAPYNSVVRTLNSDGSSSLKEIQMANKKQVIRLESADTAVGK